MKEDKKWGEISLNECEKGKRDRIAVTPEFNSDILAPVYCKLHIY